jgi:alkane 1-monooxygenase
MRYTGPFLFLAMVPVLDAWRGWGGLVVLPLIAAVLLLGAAAPPDQDAKGEDKESYRVVPGCFILALLGVILWGVTQSAAPGRSLLGLVSLSIGLGAVSGIFGLVAAHEMIHSRRRHEQFCGQALLAILSYRHFRIAHVYGHHRFAATPEDPSTARRGESCYRFLLRTIVQQWLFAWRLERRRLAGQPGAWYANRCCQDLAFALFLYAAVDIGSDWRGVLMLGVISITAIFLLEMFNYVAHYGMERQLGADLKREPMAAHHSWNARGTIPNRFLFNMGRHSDHHRRPQISYHDLNPDPAGPLLPGGYAGGILLALIPPLWARSMDRRLDALRSHQGVV